MSEHVGTESVNEKREILFHGIPASPGIAIGSILLVGAPPEKTHDATSKTITTEEVESEVDRFLQALDKTRDDIKQVQKRLQNSLQEREASIFDAHLLIVDDRMLRNEVVELIRKKAIPADTAFHQTIQRYVAAISSMQDPYLKERADDVKDVANRIVNNLNGLRRAMLDSLPHPVIIIARDLTPSDTALLDRKNVLGFAIETGSRTSHTAILARSMRIPAVVGMQRFFDRLQDGDQMIIDGFLGIVILNPKQETIDLYSLKMNRKDQLYSELLKESRLRAETLDGYTIGLLANIEGVDDIEEIQRYGAEGIGLFRTEYLYMNRKEMPGEEAQYNVYKQVAEAMQGQPVVVRTLDIGGDKLDPLLVTYHEPNPFLGLRAIRLSIDRPELIYTQLRAILRAGVHGTIRLLFPMLSSMEELDLLLDTIHSIKRQLMSEQQNFAGGMEIGIMIEIPSAALVADQLAKRVDFFSIGTNDLVQYTLAVDRTNEKVAHLYRPAHPAVLELIHRTVQAARKYQRYVTVCGEIAGDPLYVPLLVGLGVHELSMSPVSIAAVRRVIRRMSFSDAHEIARNALAASHAAETMAICKEFVSRVAPDVADIQS